MLLYFFEPPPFQRAGGLELAVSCLRSCLVSNGVVVKGGPEFDSNGSRDENALVHFHGLWQPQFLRAARQCRARKIPYLISPHGMLEPWAWKHKRWKKWPYFLLFERRHLAGAARLLATSDMEAAHLRKFFPRSNCAVIPLGLPDAHGPDYHAARLELGWPKDEKVLLYLSRIHEKKGLHLLLEGLAGLGPSGAKDLRLVIIGGGDAAYVSRVRTMAEDLRGQLPKIDWLGEMWGDGKWRYLQGADLFCLPSFSENFGLAVLEALQVGTRVLTTNTGPWEFLKNWDAAFIGTPAVDSVHASLGTFLQSAPWTDDARLALASRVRAKFGWDTLGQEYLQFYQSVMEGRRKTAS